MAPRRYYTIDSDAVLDHATEHSMHEPVVLFKHSTMCGTSHRARRQIHTLTETDDPPVYELVIQDARPLSNKITATLGIRHQSPQVIVLHRGRPIFDASHGRVTAEAVRAAIANVSTA